MFQNAFRNVTRERPPRPRLFGTGPFFDGAATPPLQGGEYARLNSGLVSIFLLQVTSNHSRLHVVNLQRQLGVRFTLAGHSDIEPLQFGNKD